jgi:endonuclease-3
MVTPSLFKKYPTPQALAHAKRDELEAIIRSTGFFRSKAKNLILCAQKIVNQHNGQIPQDIDSLANLPGVGRKTANVVLGDAFGKPAGVVVDTHVRRLSRRLGWTRHSDPVKIEKVLSSLFPPQHWVQLAHLLIWHGRRRCTARRPDCANCEIQHLCPTGSRFLKKH